jgi:NAD dependent epimerase/dehydratase family
MVTGASGLIGSAITARLISAGHNVFGLARKVKEAARRRPDAQWRKCDIARMTQSGLWVPYLDGVDAVVNCAGVLQDGPEDRREVSTPMALPLCSRRVSRRECGAWCIFPPSALTVKPPQNSLAPTRRRSQAAHPSALRSTLPHGVELSITSVKYI